MSYLRVIPRDLFNEANLLKCYGQLYLNLEKLGMQDFLEHTDDDGQFRVDQDQSSGALTISNIDLVLPGGAIALSRPLNARRPFPLYASLDEYEVCVFNEDGSFTPEMLRWLGR